MTRISVSPLLAVVLAAGIAAPALSQQGDRPPAAVTVETMNPQDVVLTATLPGRVRATAEAEVRPQVNGIIIERLFQEGSRVEEGDVLYRIDPATYEAVLAQGQAAVSQAEAQLREAEREAERAQTLQQRGINSQATEESAISARDAALAQLEVARAQLRTAQIDLDRTEVRARLSGEISFSNADAGALVTASQTEPLTVIRQLDPVNVDVTQSAAELLEWRRAMGPDGAAPGSTVGREVALTLADGSTYDQSGELTAAEPVVHEQTGVVVLRLEFANPDQLLLPGMYVQVEMPTSTASGVWLAPQEGVTRDRRGEPVALVVTPDNRVAERSLTILQDRGTDWIVSAGFEPGDRIIVAGGQNVTAGAEVMPEERDAAEDAAMTGEAVPTEARAETSAASAAETDG